MPALMRAYMHVRMNRRARYFIFIRSAPTACVCVCVCVNARMLPVSPWTSATSSKFATEMNPGASGVLDGTERRRSLSSTSLCDGQAVGRSI
jgi:hypothetical protein